MKILNRRKLLRYVIIFMLLFSLIPVHLLAVDAEGEVTTIKASEDSWIQGGDYSNINYGTSDKMKVKRTSTEARDAFIKFDTAAINNDHVSSVILKLHVVSMESATISSGGRYDIQVRGMIDNSWSEKDITYENAPDDSSDRDLGHITVEEADIGGYVALDITDFVLQHPDKLISLRIRGIDQSKGVDYASREHSSGNGPLLEVKYSDENEAPEQPEGTIYEEVATDDTYTRTGVGPFGDSPTMNIKSNSSGSDIRRAYLKFDVPKVNGILEQSLVKVYVDALEGKTPEDGYDVSMYGIEDDTWDEVMLTDDNRPDEVGVLLDEYRVNIDTVGKYIEFDVTSFVQGHEDDMVSFYIQSKAGVSRGAHYRTKEHQGGTPPLLTLTISDYEIPEVPMNLSTTVGSKQVELNWNSSANATRYEIVRSENENGPFETIAEVVSTTYVDDEVMNDYTYYYRVRGMNDSFEGEFSESISATPIYPLVVEPVFSDSFGNLIESLEGVDYLNTELEVTNMTDNKYDLFIRIDIQPRDKNKFASDSFAIVQKSIKPQGKLTVDMGFSLPENASDYVAKISVLDDSVQTKTELYHIKKYFNLID